MIKFNKETGLWELSEEELISLVSSQERLSALEGGGVDNWEGYGESISYYLGESIDYYELDEDADFEDLSKIIIENWRNDS